MIESQSQDVSEVSGEAAGAEPEVSFCPGCLRVNGKAKCFLSKDRHKLWAVIEASFGDFVPFNKMPRT